MNPYQQVQPEYPHQQNVGLSNSVPQPLGNPVSMPGFSPMEYPAPQPAYGNSSGNPQIAPSFQLSPSCTKQGNPPTNQGYPQPNVTQGYPSHSYPQVQSRYPPAGYPQGNGQHGYPQSNHYQGNVAHGQPLAQCMQAYVPISKPTLVAVYPFDPLKDAAALRKAMKGFGTDEKAIIQVLTRRTNEQRQLIAAEFKTLYGKDLISDLKSETSGKFEDLLVALMTPLPQYYAKELHDAIAGIGTNEDVLIEVMCTVLNHEINAIKQSYTAMYKTSLEDDIRGDTSGHFKKLMVSLCAGNRTNEFHVNQTMAKEDANSLFKSGELRFGTDESVFNTILCSRSLPQLAAIFKEYQLLTGHDIDDAIKAEFSGDLKKALSAIVKVVRNKPLFFAERLHKSMKGLGTNDRQLIRIMVTRCEVDLGDITEMFQHKYGETLQSWIEDDCSGYYKKCLLGLLGVY